MKELGIGMLCILSFLLPTAPLTVMAQTVDDEVCAGLNHISGSDCDPGEGASRINRLMRTAINIFSAVVGVIAVFMVIIAGVTIVTSAGDSSKISKARQSLIMVAVGIAVIALAQFIAMFVLKIS